MAKRDAEGGIDMRFEGIIDHIMRHSDKWDRGVLECMTSGDLEFFYNRLVSQQQIPSIQLSDPVNLTEILEGQRDASGDLLPHRRNAPSGRRIK